jgi:hypothetical protein
MFVFFCSCSLVCSFMFVFFCSCFIVLLCLFSCVLASLLVFFFTLRLISSENSLWLNYESS